MKKIFLIVFSFFLVACENLPTTQNLKDLIDAEVSLADINFENPAEIQFLSPADKSTDIKGMTPLTLLWKEPVLALQNHQRAKAFLAKYLTITPAHPGEWRTLGSSGIMFQPETDWRPSTRYTLSATPEILADFSYSFETQRLALLGHDSMALVGQTPLTLRFNQEVSLDKLKSNLKLQSEAETKIDISYGFKKDDSNVEVVDKTVLRLTPQWAWPQETRYELSIEPGSYGLEGDLPLVKALNLEFVTAGPFELTKFVVPPFHDRSAQFSFSAPVSSKTLAEHLVMTPEPTDSLTEKALKYWIENEYESANFYLSPPDGAWDPEIEYEIALKPGFTDVAGRLLTEGTTQRFQTDLSTFFKPVYWPNNFSVFARDAGLEPTFVYGGNTTKVTVTLNDNTKTFPLPGSAKKRQVWSLDLATEFPAIFNAAGELIPGDYRLKVMTHFAENNRFATYETRFFVSDFSVEIKASANDTFQFFAAAYPGQTALEESLIIETFVGDWQSEKRYKRVEGVKSGYTETIPANQFRSVKIISGDKIGFGSINFNQGISPWDSQANYGPWQYGQAYSGVIFTDRPLYKPAQTVHFKGILRELELFGKNFPLKSVEESQLNLDYEVVVYDPEYNEVATLNGSTQNGSFDQIYTLPAEAKLGSYRLAFKVVNADNASPFTMETPFWVQEYRKPNFLIQSGFTESQALLEETVTATLNAQYAFGGPIVDKPLNYTVTLFGNEPCRFWCWGPAVRKDKVITSGEGKLNEKGQFNLEIDLEDLELEAADWNLLTLNATINVSEAEQSSTEVSIPFSMADRVLELQATPNFLASQENTNLRGSVENLEGEALASAKVELRLLQTKWVRNERKNADDNFYGEWESVETEIETLETKTDESGGFEFDFTAPIDGGEYIFEFLVVDEKGRSTSVRRYFWVSGSDLNQVRENNTNNILWLFPNQDTYEIAETVEVFAPNAAFKPTRVHATLERGEVLEELEFEPETSTVSFVIEPWMSPNVFVSILMEGVDENGEMQVKWGAHPIKIEDPSRALALSVIPEKRIYRPGDEVALNIETQINEVGHPAEVSIAVVDQTLLALRSRVPLDLMASLIGEWPLGVNTLHSLANFVSASEMAEIMEEVQNISDRLEMGFGGGGGKGDDFKPRGDFRDTAEFVAQFETDESGKGVYKFTLPDNLTTWNIFAVGATTDNAFGTSTADFQVTLPLLISEIMPNFFQAGDELELGLLIYRDDHEIAEENVKVTLNLPPEIEVLGSATQTVAVQKEARVYFNVRVKPSFENKTVFLGYSLESQASDLKDEITLQRDILPPSMSLSAAVFERVNESFTIKPVVDSAALNSSLTVKVFASLADSLETLVKVAEKVNYGCTEQRLALLVAQLYQQNLNQALDRDLKTVDREVLETTRSQIEASYIDGGGFAFWESSTQANFWVTTQVLEHAPLLATAGVGIEQSKLERSAQWLRTQLLKTCESDFAWHCLADISRVQAAAVLVDYNLLTVNDLEFLSTYTESLEAKVWWLRATEKLGVLPPALEALKGEYLTALEQAYIREDRYGFWEEQAGAFYSQDERLTALILETFMNQEVFASEYEFIARYLSETPKERLSGNSAMQVLKTLARYVETQEKESMGAQFTFQNETENEVLLKGSLQDLNQVQVYENKTAGALSEQNLTLTTDKPVLLDFELRETLPASAVEANARGFWIEREVRALNGLEAAEEEAETLELGQNYLVKLKVVTGRAHRQVLVEDPIPSGSEIVNFEFDNADQTLAGVLENEPCVWGWCQPLLQHKEYRLDRARFFIDYLPAGTHEITYILRPRLSGEFEWLPAKVEEMYAPEVAANNEGRTIRIEASKN